MSGFESIEERLDNWGATVRSPRFKPEVCAQWARLHVALRDKAMAEMALPLEQKDGCSSRRRGRRCRTTWRSGC
ncbi:hypothetical protein [Burkholderia multivorans]|uniref:hypothetical protein n=1 Tax=Burkholderia multivorans TaxID=87883 RepID=UPI0020B3E013|nr:hypothetical protein [Burkholderia multivorans]MDN7477758.1 hypothetical protein [Burkholderia multivorans]